MQKCGDRTDHTAKQNSLADRKKRPYLLILPESPPMITFLSGKQHPPEGGIAGDWTDACRELSVENR
jgi:hypothetical protein